MKKISLTVVILLFVLGVATTLWQGGKATTLTWWSWVPLALYLLLWGIGWARAAIAKARASS